MLSVTHLQRKKPQVDGASPIHYVKSKKIISRAVIDAMIP